MPEDIGQCFLNDPEGCGLYLRRQPWKIPGLNLERRFDAAALGKSIHIPGKRRLQTNLIEQRRMQEMRHCADLLNRAINNLNDLDPGFLWELSDLLQQHSV